jgi:hypothetical protein
MPKKFMSNDTIEEAEAIQAEEIALKEVNDDEVRSQVIEKYGIDPELNPELVDQLVEDKKEANRKLSIAIKQKQTWRDKANKPAEVKTVEVKTQADTSQFVTREELEQKEYDSLEASDLIKQETKNYAKLNKIDPKQAFNSEYITFLRDKENQKAKVEEASISTKRNSPTKKDFSSIAPKDIDQSTAEGRKQWEEYMNWVKTQ